MKGMIYISKLKVISLFSGIGAFEKGLKRQGIDYDLSSISEIEIYPLVAYATIHCGLSNYEHLFSSEEDLDCKRNHIRPLGLTKNNKPVDVDKLNTRELNSIYYSCILTKNLGDIGKIESLEKYKGNVDLIVGGSPCQDFSIAGKQQGSMFKCLDCNNKFNPLVIHYHKRYNCPKCNSDNIEKTRSSLLIEYLRSIREVKPKYFIYENVKNIIGKKFKDAFDMFKGELREYGYNIHYQILNAKNYGIPQNRERVFVIGIRKDIGDDFNFPQSFDNGLRLKDLLQDIVEDKYYIDNERTSDLLRKLKKEDEDVSSNISVGNNDGRKEPYKVICEQRTDEGLRFFKDDVCGTIRTIDSGGDKRVIEKTNEPKRLGGLFDSEKQKRQAGAVWDKNCIAPTVDTCQGGYREPSIIEELPKVVVKEATKKGYAIATIGDSINVSFPNSKTRRGRVGEGVAQTLETGCNQVTLESNYKIRKLTPRECWRLMGFEDEDYYKARKALETTYYNGKDRSNSQMYKMAGNSIVVNVLMALYESLFKDCIN